MVRLLIALCAIVLLCFCQLSHARSDNLFVNGLGRKQLICTTSCQVICTKESGRQNFYDSASAQGTNADNTCKAAKKIVNDRVPRGCQKKHCSACRDCGGN